MVIPEGDEFVLSFLGALFAGVVPVPIYPQLTFKNIESYHDTVCAHRARVGRARMLLTTTATRPYVEPALARVETLRAIVTVDELAGRRAARSTSRVTLRRTSRSSSSRAAAPRAPRA